MSVMHDEIAPTLLLCARPDLRLDELSLRSRGVKEVLGVVHETAADVSEINIMPCSAGGRRDFRAMRGETVPLQLFSVKDEHSR